MGLKLWADNSTQMEVVFAIRETVLHLFYANVPHSSVKVAAAFRDYGCAYNALGGDQKRIQYDHSSRRRLQGHSPPRKFGIYFGQRFQLRLILLLRRDACAGIPPLFGGFKEEFSDAAVPQALNEIEKRAVLESAPTSAVGLAAGQILLDVGCPQEIRRNTNLLQQIHLFRLQVSDGSFAQIKCLSHKNI
jgi:hypothetical protein